MIRVFVFDNFAVHWRSKGHLSVSIASRLLGGLRWSIIRSSSKLLQVSDKVPSVLELLGMLAFRFVLKTNMHVVKSYIILHCYLTESFHSRVLNYKKIGTNASPNCYCCYYYVAFITCTTSVDLNLGAKQLWVKNFLIIISSSSINVITQ